MRHKAICQRMFRRSAMVAVVLASLGALISSAPAAPVPQATAGGNAADSWRKAAPLLKPRSDTNPGGLLSVDDWNTLSLIQGRDHRSDAEIEQARVLISRLEPLMALLDDAAAQRRCDFQLDRSQGFALLMPHLSTMRAGTRMLQLRGDIQASDGDMRGFIDAQAAIARVALQPVQDDTLIGSLVGNAIADVDLMRMQRAIDEGALSQQLAKDAIEALAPIQGEDPMRFQQAPAKEFEMLQEELKRASERPHGGRDFYQRLGIEPREADGRDRPSPREMLAALPAVKPLYDVYSQALGETDPAKARALMQKAETMVANLKPPASSLRMLLPSFDRALEVRERFLANRDRLMQALQAIAADPEGAARHTAPAVLWARVAARVCALPNDVQTAVEILRAQGPEHAGEFTAKAIACLEGCDTTIFEAMRVAAACERKDLDFSKVPGLRAWPPLPTLGGLRGAARLAAARISMLDTDRAIAHLDLAFAAAAALASDPSQASSCASLAIVRELVPTVAALARRADLDEQRRARLDAAVNRIDRKDPFGFRTSLAAERLLLAPRVRPLEQDAERLRKDIARRSPEWVMAMRVETDKVHTPVTDAGPLEDTADLFLVERLEKAAASAREVESLINDAARTDGKADAQRRTTLASLPVPPLRDPAPGGQEAQAVLSALDAGLKPAPAAR